MESSGKQAKLFLFTAGYPLFSGEQHFLREEIQVLSKTWDVTVVPTRPFLGEVGEVPPGVEVKMDLVRSSSWQGLTGTLIVRSLSSKIFWSEIAKYFPRAFHPMFFWTSVLYLAKALRIADWIVREKLGESEPSSTLFYVWWTHWHALGVILGTGKSPIKVVSRAHGYDIFSEQSKSGYIPFHSNVLGGVHRVYASSAAGHQRLCEIYPQHRDKICLSRLGTTGPEFLSQSSGDRSLHVVSISYAHPIKRLALVADAIELLIENHPQLEVSWSHVGGGADVQALEKRVRDSPTLAKRVNLLGLLKGRKEVLSFLAQNKFDVALNASASEGVSIALVEALSSGIPLMVSSVGGNVELAMASGGVLLPAHPSPAEISEALATFAKKSPDEIARLRNRARRTWEEIFQADVNYTQFSSELQLQMESGNG